MKVTHFPLTRRTTFSWKNDFNFPKSWFIHSLKTSGILNLDLKLVGIKITQSQNLKPESEFSLILLGLKRARNTNKVSLNKNECNVSITPEIVQLVLGGSAPWPLAATRPNPKGRLHTKLHHASIAGKEGLTLEISGEKKFFKLVRLLRKATGLRNF